MAIFSKFDFTPSCCWIAFATIPLLYRLAACFVSSYRRTSSQARVLASALDTNPTVGDAKPAYRISSRSPLFESRFRTMIERSQPGSRAR
jgi:hypothetical protein